MTEAGRLAHAELHRFSHATATPCPGPSCPHKRIVADIEAEAKASGYAEGVIDGDALARGAAPLACNCNAEMYGNGDRHSDDCATGLGAAPRAEGLLREVDQAFVPVYGPSESGTRVDLAARFRAWLAAPQAEGLDVDEVIALLRAAQPSMDIPPAQWWLRRDELLARLSRPSDESVPESEEPR